MLPTKKFDGRALQRTDRTKQLNLKVTEEFYELVYQLAQEEGLLLTELVEKAVLDYQKKKNKKLKKVISRERERERERERAIGGNLPKNKTNSPRTKN